MPRVPTLPQELSLLLQYLLDAACQNHQYSDSTLLDDALLEIRPEERVILQEYFPQINVSHALSSTEAFIKVLSSPELAPITFISPLWLLTICPSTRLDADLISDLLVNDLVRRLEAYLYNTPLIIRLGIYSAWLKADQNSSTEELLTECICQSRAPLLQKLVQMIGDASAASEQLQKVKDRVAPMSDRELTLVLEDAGVSHLFEHFERESSAAGSIGQGHHARLLDGTDVFVKVKRYGVCELMQAEARIFNAPLQGSGAMAGSPWAEMANTLIRETSFLAESENQKRLKQQWNQDSSVNVVEILSQYPSIEPTVLIMRTALGTTVGRASVRFPIGLQHAVHVLNTLLHRFYINTLFYTVVPQEVSTKHGICGYAPADPHAANLMLHVDEETGDATLTIIDTASICTITNQQRHKIIDLLIAVVMSDAQGIAELFGFSESHIVEWETACAVYRHILHQQQSGASRDGQVIKRLVRIVEATQLVLKRTALEDLLLFGKAQLQLLDTIQQFARRHSYEMNKLNLKFDSMTEIFLRMLLQNNARNRGLAKRALWAFASSAGRKFGDSFTSWDLA